MDAGYQQELKRKAFHLSSIIFPLAYYFLSPVIMISIMIVIASVTLYVDKVRHTNILIQDLVDKFFKHLMREKEYNGSFMLSGTSYMMAGFLMSAILFPKGVTIVSWLILIISDSVAALVGKRIGIPRITGKSFEGSTAFFISSIMIGLFSYGFTHFHGGFMGLFLACLATTVAEYYSSQIGIDDNFTVPMTFGVVMTLCGWIL